MNIALSYTNVNLAVQSSKNFPGRRFQVAWPSYAFSQDVCVRLSVSKIVQIPIEKFNYDCSRRYSTMEYRILRTAGNYESLDSRP